MVDLSEILQGFQTGLMAGLPFGLGQTLSAATQLIKNVQQGGTTSSTSTTSSSINGEEIVMQMINKYYKQGMTVNELIQKIKQDPDYATYAKFIPFLDQIIVPIIEKTIGEQTVEQATVGYVSYLTSELKAKDEAIRQLQQNNQPPSTPPVLPPLTPPTINIDDILKEIDNILKGTVGTVDNTLKGAAGTVENIVNAPLNAAKNTAQRIDEMIKFVIIAGVLLIGLFLLKE
jgi:hypothetical protein